MTRARIAVIGGGAAGLCTAWLLGPSHEVTLYEAAAELGGHAKTVIVPTDAGPVHVDVGFKYFHDFAFPTLLALLRVLGLRPRRCRSNGTFSREGLAPLVLPPRSARHAVRALARRSTLAWLRAAGRIGRSGAGLLASGDWRVTFRDFARRRFSVETAEEFLLPFAAATWGAPIAVMADFPAMDVLSVMRSARGLRPRFYEIDDGVATYVGALAADCRGVELRVGCAVESLELSEQIALADGRGETRRFDQVVIATEAYSAAALIQEDPDWSAALERFEHFDTRVVVHRDPSFMPPDRGDWSQVNVSFDGRHPWMTEWPGWGRGVPVFRTWLPPHRQVPQSVVWEGTFRHLAMTTESPELQGRIATLQGRRGVHLAGMYTCGYDIHESAIMSAVAVAKRLAPQSPNLERLSRALEDAR